MPNQTDDDLRAPDRALLREIALADLEGRSADIDGALSEFNLTQDARKAVHGRLLDGGFVTGSRQPPSGTPMHVRIDGPTELGLAAVGLALFRDPLERLIEALERQVASESDESKRSKYQRLLDALHDVATSGLGGVLTQAVLGVAGQA